MILLPMLLIISILAFFMLNLSPVDPAEAALRAKGSPVITDEMIQQERIALGLDKPLHIQYISWLGNCFHLDFGISYTRSKPVAELILPAFINTLKLAAAGSVSVILFSVLLGVLCAVFEGTAADRVIRTFAIGIGAVPSYWVGIILILLVSVRMNLLPTSGMGSGANYVLPVAVLTISHLGFYFRLIRNSMIQNKQENYVVYERASGLPERVVIRHILKNSMQTAVSAFCMAVSGMVAGTVLVENIFAWPGMGRLCVSSILNHDYPVIQAYILIIAVVFVLFNLISDIINAAMNPKLREK